LAAAARLQAQGFDVTLLEQNAQLGGKMGQIEAEGYRWDTGPSVITMRHVFEDLFEAVGRKMADYVTLLPVEPLTRYFWRDGTLLDASRDIAKMARQIRRIDERDVEGYLAFLSYAARLHRIVGPVFIYDKPPRLASFLKVAPWDAVRVDGLRTMHQAASSFVRSRYLRQLLGRFATYVGASPYQAPATLNVIGHVEMTEGVYYPRGGIYTIAEGLGRLATELGVTVRVEAPVARICTEGGRVTGVQLASGEALTADAVIANVDVNTVYEGLLPNAEAPPAREPSCSGFILMLGVEGTHPDLAHHNVLFSDDYRAEFREIFSEGVPPDDPTIYVAITSKTDADHAPPGCENWFVLVNAPPLGDAFDWGAHAGAYQDLVLRRLAEWGYDIRDKIRVERMLTPVDIERLTGARLGALYGASSNNRWAAFRRPNNRAPDIEGLYFAGGTTHPGGGVPMVTLSGKVAAEMIMSDYPKA
jgi:phytoene desaturase